MSDGDNPHEPAVAPRDSVERSSSESSIGLATVTGFRSVHDHCSPAALPPPIPLFPPVPTIIKEELELANRAAGDPSRREGEHPNKDDDGGCHGPSTKDVEDETSRIVPVAFCDSHTGGLFSDEEDAGEYTGPDSNSDCQLSQDSFSFLIASNFWSASWWLGVTTFCFKTGIFALVVVNLGSQSITSSAPLAIPAIVTTQVAIAQFVSILVTVLSQDDLRVSVQYFYLGYYRISLATALPHATPCRYWTSACLQLFGGVFGLVTTFLLIITSDEVIEIILNLTAIEFVSLLDNTVFAISRQGFFGSEPSRQAGLIANAQYSAAPGRRALRQHLQILTLVLSFVVLVAGWIYFFVQQVNGNFAVKTFYAQFDDNVVTDLGTYSGYYQLVINRGTSSLGNRIRYESENRKSSAYFGYCISSEKWTFSLDGGDPCIGPVMRSAHTLSLDLAKIGDDEWFVANRRASTTFYRMEGFFLSPGCASDDDCGGVENGGACLPNSKCSCLEATFGARCAFSEAALNSVIGRADGVSIFDRPRDVNVGYASEFQILRSPEDGKVVLAYLHPVYFKANRFGQLDVLLYTGLRWVLTTTDVGFPRLDPSSFKKSQLAEALASYLRESTFYAPTELGLVDYMSKPTRFGTPDDTVSPTQVSWWSLAETQSLANAKEGRDITERLSGLFCTDDSDCGRGGTCDQEMRSCDCGADSAGQLCQLLSLGDGHCDEHLNNGFNDFDGGDCCEETCQDSKEHRCGYSRNGTTHVGFSNSCSDAFVRPVNITLTVGFDTYPEEVTMTLTNGNKIVKQWGPFDVTWSGKVWTETLEIRFSSSVFTLTINDAGNDGMVSARYSPFVSVHYGKEDLLDMLLLYFLGEEYLSQVVRTFTVRKPIAAVPDERLFVIFSGSSVKDTSWALKSQCNNDVQKLEKYDPLDEAFQWWRDDSGHLFNVACRYKPNRTALMVSRSRYPDVFMSWVRANKDDPKYPKINSQWQVNRIDNGHGEASSTTSPVVEFRNRWAWQVLTSDRNRLVLKERDGDALPSNEPKWRLEILDRMRPED